MQIRPAVANDGAALFDIWLRSVRATHDFLSESDIQSMVPAVRTYLSTGAASLWVHCEDGIAATAFMGLSADGIDALFVAPEHHGRGVGRRLVEYARRLLGDDLRVEVNEQNPGARAFYEACGFVVEGRSDVDRDGRPFPLLLMRRQPE
jgi:putative acetyltransferase